MQRRQFIATGAALLAQVLALPGWAGDVNEVGQRNLNAFNARSPASVYAALGIAPPEHSDAIEIIAPDVAENGANVPVEVQSSLNGVERILIIGERNLFPLLADASFDPGLAPWFETRVKLAETTSLRVIVQARGKLYSNARTVRVIVGGCIAG